ncbi:MAG: hypothetical protein AB7E47_02525 [Desulfovibrionaceae bacterium]
MPPTPRTMRMGLARLLTERRLQAQVLIPLATSPVCGLPASTVLVLSVVPARSAMPDDFGLTAMKKNPFAS